MPKRPNILLVMCDQLRSFEVGCYGNAAIRTPHMDRLGGAGVRFETAVSNNPVCMPARSAAIAGQYSRSCSTLTNASGNPGHGASYMPEYPLAGRPHLKDPTLPEALRQAGYHTAVIGKWHIHSWPQDVGFDDYLIPRVHHCYSGQSFLENGGPEFVPPGWSVDYEADRVEQFLRARSGDAQPFFLFYSTSPPHCPMADAPEKYLTMYRPQDMPLRANVLQNGQLPYNERHFKVYRWDFRHYTFHLPHTETLPDPCDLRHIIALYYGMTTWVDDCLGRVLAALDRCGLAEDTIVVFTSDHGDMLGSHGMYQKGNFLEESIRIPMIVRWPGPIRPAVARRQVASLADLGPTLLDLAGLEPPGTMTGRSLADILRLRRDRLDDDAAYIENPRGIAIRTLDRLLALRYAQGTHVPENKPSQLFDLAADPCELTNLAEAPHAPAWAAQLQGRLMDWHQRTPWLA